MDESRQPPAHPVLHRGTASPQRGTNSARVGTLNRALVLDVVRRHGPVARTTIATTTGLTAQTVSNIAARLLQEGLLREARGPAHEPQRLLGIAPDARYAVGLHLDPARVVAVLVDLAGTVLASESLDAGALQGPDEVLDAMAAMTERLLAARPAEVRDRLLGIGVAAPGPLDPAHAVLAAPVQLPGWAGMPVADELGRRTGLAVVLEKDGVAAGLGEAWTTTNTTGIITVTLGHGISAAVIAEGRVVRGATGNAGEFGGMPVQAHGRWTAVWEACQPLQQVERAIAAGVLPAATPTGCPADVRTAYEALCAMPEGAPLVEAGGTALGSALAHVVELLDVTDVVVGGSSAIAGGAVFLDAVRAGLADRLPGPSRTAVSGTAYGEAAVARGAACAVLASALDAAPASRPEPVRAVAGRSPRARSIAHPW
ncbi:ROK family protein [Curtobacterium sp. MCPF17_002]|uniref:ROK family protein n=1 Tax=Curtobacterium sp. MCPF17_002 TaxID=2175645 RepID=UPI0015E8C115|nr:ROK family protein [Curtobacterium sp. MCPF17_002]WIB79043.1 ROK family protein [Curtobacterium sp. MCPF17_002]